MHLFLSLFLFGLILGAILYGTTYFITKNIDYKQRSYILIIVGTVFATISFSIGGFEGMPIIFIGLGVFLLAILLLIFGKINIYRRMIIALTLFITIFVFIFFQISQTEYWIMEKNVFSDDKDYEVTLHLEKLENKPHVQGYKIFGSKEESPIIVLSLGSTMKNNNIEVLDVTDEYDKTIIKVKTFSRNAVSKNPFVIIGLDKVKSNIEIIDTDGTKYEEIN